VSEDPRSFLGPVFEKGYPSFEAVNRKPDEEITLEQLKQIFVSNGLDFFIASQTGKVVKVNFMVKSE
jgi:hypothetical protein